MSVVIVICLMGSSILECGKSLIACLTAFSKDSKEFLSNMNLTSSEITSVAQTLLAKEALQKPSLILRSESFCLLHRLNFYANDCSGYF